MAHSKSIKVEVRKRTWVDFIKNISNLYESQTFHWFKSPRTEENSLFLPELVHEEDVLGLWRPIFLDGSKF